MGRHSRAIVTMALGNGFLDTWKRTCETNWREYADRHRFDLICLEQPLDTTARAAKRSPAWQKCLILSQPFSEEYAQLVWIDADILINNRLAPDIAACVPVGAIGAAEDGAYSSTDPVGARMSLDRAYAMWPDGIVNYTARDYYVNYGLPGDCDRVLNTGVMIASPQHHRALFEHVYYGYEEKGGREWHMEMRPLSYEIVKSGLVHWIDPRFNMNWGFMKLLYYPYLVDMPRRASANRRARLETRARAFLRARTMRRMRTAAVNSAFRLSYFLHLGGPNMDLAGLVNERADWWSPTF